MKKIVSTLLAATVLAGIMTAASANSAPSAAPAYDAPDSVSSAPAPRQETAQSDAESVDERLKAVTLAVKEKLGIGDEYTSFYGNMSEINESVTHWLLEWSKDGEYLTVTSGEDGKIYSMNNYKPDNQNYKYEPFFAPSFPSMEQDAAKKAAESFLSRVLGSGESVELTSSDYIGYARQSDFNFNGGIKINGLPSPFSVSITVRMQDMKVSNFWRSDTYNSPKNAPPSPAAEITADKAKELFKPEFKLEPLYIASPDDPKLAVIAYVPLHSLSDWIVNAKTGKLLKTSGYGYSPYPAAESAMDTGGSASSLKGLSGAELEGIAKLEGIMTKEELSAAVRAYPLLGLTSDYEVSSLDYTLDKENSDVFANISFRAKITNQDTFGISNEAWDNAKEYGAEVIRQFRINAQTGGIISFYTYYSGIYGKYEDLSSPSPTLPESAQNAIKSLLPDLFDKCGLYLSTRTDAGYKQESFTYYQSVNGYYYKGNSIQVTYNPASGFIDSLYTSWDDEISFTPAGSVISESDAIAKYADALSYPLEYELYSSEPEKIYYSAPELLLAYKAKFDYNIQGVDAVSGEILFTKNDYAEKKIEYKDISDSPAKAQIEKLAKYAVGFYASDFKPNAKLLEKDMLLFLVSANGTKYDYEQINDEVILNQVYETAYYLGIIERGKKNPERVVTRAEFAATLVEMSGYGKAAKLPGIYVCGFSDDAGIPEELYGYVSIAKGLGVIKAGADGAFDPNGAVTRTDAAIMLYNFMSR